MLMSGKIKPISCSTLSADSAAVAAYLQQPDAPALCVVPDGAVADAVKRAFTGSRHLPLIIPLPKLLAAAAVLPIEAGIIHSALFWEQPTEDDRWVWQMYDSLSDYCGASYAAPARLELARALVRLLLEVDAHLALSPGQNPFAALTAQSYEAEVADKLWAVLNENAEKAEEAGEGAEVFATQPLLRRLAAVLPPFAAVVQEEPPPPLLAFYQQCGAPLLQLAPPPALARWEEAFTVEGTMPAECDHLAYQGVGDTLTQTAALALAYINNFLAAEPAEPAEPADPAKPAQPAESAESAENRRLGIVVYDRVLARRLRAMAEAEAVRINDRRGWRAESLMYGAALSLYADSVLDEFNLEQLGELLAVPFLCRAVAAGGGAGVAGAVCRCAAAADGDAGAVAAGCAGQSLARYFDRCAGGTGAGAGGRAAAAI